MEGVPRITTASLSRATKKPERRQKKTANDKFGLKQKPPQHSILREVELSGSKELPKRQSEVTPVLLLNRSI
jgi:hypothetical protein